MWAAQVENDVYCTYANRANSEFKYSPVPSNTNITTLSGTPTNSLNFFYVAQGL